MHRPVICRTTYSYLFLVLPAHDFGEAFSGLETNSVCLSCKFTDSRGRAAVRWACLHLVRWRTLRQVTRAQNVFIMF